MTRWVSSDQLYVSPLPYDHTLFEQTSFRVIAETVFVSHIGGFNFNDPWLTEKTWITIFNSHPFIMVGEVNTLSKLKQLGYKTFEDYLLIKEYDTLPDKDRLDATVKNTGYWLEHLSDHKEQIQNDVEHNFKQFVTLAQVEIEKVNNLMKRYNLTCPFSSLINTSDPNH